MSATPPAGLDTLVEYVQQRLSAAATDPVAPWRTPMLATVTADGAPSLRTVVLRSVDPLRRILRINTDRYSAKAEHIARNAAVEMCFWDATAREQLRVAGSAVVETSGAAVEAAWSALPADGRAVYRHAPAPGTPTPGPHPVDHPPLDPAGGNRSAFATLIVTWHAWDWVWLGEYAHRRARLRWTASGQLDGGWTVP